MRVDKNKESKSKSRARTLLPLHGPVDTGELRSHALRSHRKGLGLQEDPHALCRPHDGNADHVLWSRIRLLLREPFLEFWGVFVAVLLGNAATAQALLSETQKPAPGGGTYGNWITVCWGWSVGMMMGMYVAGDSGAYLNPSVTITNCILRRLPWRRFPPYFVAQILGAFCASGLVYANYVSAIDQFEGHGIRTVSPNPTATASIFTTYPQTFVPLASQFFSEFIPSAILTFCIFAFKDENGADLKAGTFFPLAFFFLTFGLCVSFGWETGANVNFARDLGPRVMSYFLGYGREVWSTSNWYFWRPPVASLSGCISGGLLYDIFIYTGDSPINTPAFGLKEPAVKCYRALTGGSGRGGHDSESEKEP